MEGNGRSDKGVSLPFEQLTAHPAADDRRGPGLERRHPG